MTSPQDPEKSWYRLHLWQIQAVRDLLVIAVLVGLVWLGSVVSVVTVPLLVALALAYIVEPLLVWLTTRMPRLGRKRAVLGLLLGGVVAVTLVVLLAVPVITREIRSLGENAGKYAERARHGQRSRRAGMAARRGRVRAGVAAGSAQAVAGGGWRRHSRWARLGHRRPRSRGFRRRRPRPATRRACHRPGCSRPGRPRRGHTRPA
ncbi:MAG: AI-2E family transporter [Planctomycetes bacterium]|nr:AI-2E family transporter [Planctomycetota bacterium]